MNKTPLWVTICSLVVAGLLNGLVTTIGATWPAAGKEAATIAGLAVAGAGIALAIYQAANSTAPSVRQDAPVLNENGVEVGKNVSTTSTLPIQAPQAPKA